MCIRDSYVDVFRGLPAIINIYLIGFGIPLTGLPIVNDFSQNTFAILALTLTYGAYVAEVYRAGIESIHWSQTAAARSLGLSFMQTMRYVIVPQAVRRIIPPLLNDFIGLQKDTALVNVIGTIDAFNQANRHFEDSHMQSPTQTPQQPGVPSGKPRGFQIHKVQAAAQAAKGNQYTGPDDDGSD